MIGEQSRNLERVTERIGHVILEFFQPPRETFHGDDLFEFVKSRVTKVAPGSPDRVMCALRQKGVIDYEVTCRSASEYRILRCAPTDHQLDLFSEQEIQQMTNKENLDG